MIFNIYSFWHGKVSLWKSYWIVGELLNALVLLAIFNFEIYVFNNNQLLSNLPFINFNNFSVFSKIFFLIWTIYISVGIWRSAENYRGYFIWIFLTLLIISYRIFTLRLLLF